MEQMKNKELLNKYKNNNKKNISFGSVPSF